MKAREIMSSPVVSVSPSTAVRDAAEMMVTHDISGLPVVDEAGRLVGIISEADLLFKEAEPKPETPPLFEEFGHSLWLERRLSGYRKMRGRTVGEVMTRNVITAGEDTPVSQLATLMTRYQINRVPIVRETGIAGIVTRADILKAFLRDDAAVAEEAARIWTEFRLPGETVEVAVEKGVVMVRGRVATPGRRAALLRQLEGIDGVVTVDDTQFEHLLQKDVAVWD